MTYSPADHRMMARALQLAARGLYTAHPNPRVGCVLAHGEEVVGEGWHEKTGGPHAEILALGRADARARGATAYVTLEPCCHQGRTPPCTEALIGAGISRVVYSLADPNPRVSGAGARQLREAGVQVDADIMVAEARALNVGFFARMERGTPWVRLKIAASLDGRTALERGASRWITGEAARADGHAWRARSSAVLTGSGTIIQDDPRLTVRRADLGPVLQPERIIVDSTLRTPTGARIIKESGATRIFTTAAASPRRSALEHGGAIVEEVAAVGGRVDLAAVMSRLAELEMNEVLVEAGATLNTAILAAGLVDELLVYLAPCLLGGDAQPMVGGLGLESLEDRIELVPIESRSIGSDLRLRLAVRSS